MNDVKPRAIGVLEASGGQPWVLPGTPFKWQTQSERLADLADCFTPITLEEMEEVALLNRKDTKYVMTNNRLLAALPLPQNDYRILTVKGRRLNRYRSLYFDTPDFKLYHQHVNGRADRYKVRSREYTETHQSYLEVKHKTNRDLTIKDRYPTFDQVVQISQGDQEWLATVYPYESANLEAKIWNTFTRLTLANLENCERVTLDFDLAFYMDGRSVHLEEVAIAEVKMDAACRRSAFVAQMHALRIQPQGFSKYCMGVAMIYDQVKKNALKPTMLMLNKITEGNFYHD